MNYNKIYDQLILKCQIRQRGKNKKQLIKELEYVERHHIIPVSMGGTNNKTNLVFLTGKEHLIAHLLLWKCYKNQSMSAAIWFMANSRGIKINSRTYEALRIEHSKNASMARQGKLASIETREKMSKSFTGRIFSEEHKANISKGRKGKISPMKGKSFNLLPSVKPYDL